MVGVMLNQIAMSALFSGLCSANLAGWMGNPRPANLPWKEPAEEEVP